jgi:formaldehyde-activating enzyme involved in methanogenesis
VTPTGVVAVVVVQDSLEVRPLHLVVTEVTVSRHQLRVAARSMQAVAAAVVALTQRQLQAEAVDRAAVGQERLQQTRLVAYQETV